ncbi:hypothetical protein [Oceanithermus sp.]
MKTTVRILILAGALLSVGALAQFSKQTQFNYYFPTYAAIYTNVTQVDFFNSSTGTQGALVQNGISGYYPSTENGVIACLDAATTLPNSYTIGGTAASASLSCNFAPNAVTKDQGFSVSGYTNASTTADTDGELLIITNSSTFGVGVEVSGSISDATIFAIPDYIDATPAIANDKSGQDVTAISFSDTDAYATQYSNAKVIPLLFYASVDVFNATALSTADDITVTWTVSAP